MIKAPEHQINKLLYVRLIAFWVICEAFAGGILHGFKIPLTGLGVSSLSVLCIVLIGYYFPHNKAILKATVLVAIFKLMLSPHAPPTAYIALFFQGLTGQLLLGRKFFRIGAILLGILALTESAIQRILVLVIIYGKTFWKAVDEFVLKLFSASHIDSFSFKLALAYVAFHAVVGFCVGKFAASVALKASVWKNENLLLEKGFSPLPEQIKKVKINKMILFVWILLMVLYFQQYLPGGILILGKESVIQILLRTLIIITGWIAFIAPTLKIFLKRRLESSKSKYEKDIITVMQLLPEIKFIVAESWKRSVVNQKKNRQLFVKMVLTNILYRN